MDFGAASPQGGKSIPFQGEATPLTEGDLNAEAQRLGCEAAAIRAVCDVESAGSGFLPDRRPKILFEAHYFHTLTHGIYDRAYPNLSSPVWDRSLYGAAGTHQYDRLAVAIGLNRAAALESASWGRFQIMGANYKAAGSPDIETFVQGMVAAEVNHLTAFGNFCQFNRLTGFLIAHDWAHFALGYNGPGHVSDYAGKLSSAYQGYVSSSPAPPSPTPSTGLKIGARGSDVLSLQKSLRQLGFVIDADGIFGVYTAAAVMSIQDKFYLPADGVAGADTNDIIALSLKNLSMRT